MTQTPRAIGGAEEGVKPSIDLSRERYNRIFGVQLRKRRERWGSTQEVIAKKLGLDLDAYALIEDGEREMTMFEFRAWCDATCSFHDSVLHPALLEFYNP